MTLAGLTSPMLFAFGLIPTLLFFTGAVLAYLWLDRWEPEPMRLLIFAFLWGAGVAVAGALVVGVVFEVAGFTDQTFGMVAEAPDRRGRAQRAAAADHAHGSPPSSR